MSYKEEEVREATLQYFAGDELATNVWMTKYALKNKQDEFEERSPGDMHDRLAKEFARIEQKYPNPLSYEEIRPLFDQFKYIVPQGSPMFGIGNNHTIQSLGNCFVVQAPYDSYGGILKSDQELAQLMKRRAGVGLDISTIRPQGRPTSNAARTTDGIGVFMERFSNTCREVAQNGRRGALMLTLSVHHPEIETFINIKRDLTKVTGANISIRLSDEFMKAVQEGEEYELRWPVDSKEPEISNKVDAGKIWEQIIDSAWASAEPGLLFWDKVKNYSPSHCYGEKDGRFLNVSTNPCLTEDTWILTAHGERQIKDLVGRQFEAIVDGKSYLSTEQGFWKTGNKDVLLVETKEGYKVKSTSNHKFLTTNGWVEAEDLKSGDSLVLSKNNCQPWNGGEGTFEEGWLIGELVGDGCYNKNSYGAQLSFWGDSREEMYHRAVSYIQNLSFNSRSDFGTRDCTKNPVVVNSSALTKLAERYVADQTKELKDEVFKESYDFIRGFIRGLFDADGSVQGNLKKGVSVRLAQSNLQLLEQVQRMLINLGINSRIYANRRDEGERLLPDGCGGQKEYYCQADHELVVSKENIETFYHLIGFGESTKFKRLQTIIDSRSRNPYKDKFVATVANIQPIGRYDVFDCTIPTIHRFSANGVIVHNCGEIPMGQDSCRLMLLNLASYVDNAFLDNASFDYELFFAHASIAQRLMDDLIDLELEKIDKIIHKIESDPEPEEVKRSEMELWKSMKETCEMGRRTGLGITGLGDALAMLGITYGSDKSIEVTDKIYMNLASAAYLSSINLASERGSFPLYDPEIRDEFTEHLFEADSEYSHLLKAQHGKHGRRNIACLTTAPAGSVSILTQTTSGCEPAYMLGYKRRRKVTHDEEFDFVDDLGDKWKEFMVYHHNYKKWMETVSVGEGETMSEEKLVSMSPYCGATANEVDWVASVRLQAAAQKWVDHAISKTCNLPNSATRELVSDVYMEAWKSGCKGFTVYRDGSRSGVLVSNDTTEDTDVFPDNSAPVRPDELPCEIHHSTIKGEKWTIFVGLLDGKPYEVFGGKADKIELPRKYSEGRVRKHPRKTKNSIYDLTIGDDEPLVIKNVVEQFDNPNYGTHTRLVSLALRHGASVEYVVSQLQKDKYSDMFGFSRVLARVLKKYVPDGTTPTGEKVCSSCETESLIYQDGCVQCANCGWSKC